MRASGPDIRIAVMLAFETYRGARARRVFTPDALLEYLVAKPDNVGLLVADAPRSVLQHAKRMLSSPGQRRHRPVAHVAPIRLGRHDPVDFAAAVASHGRALRQVARAAACRGLDRPLLLATHPFTAAAAAAADWAEIVYYGWDDWAAHPRFARWHEAINRSYDRIRDRNLRVVGVTSAIVARIGSQAPGLVLSNGLHPDEWTDPTTEPTWLADAPRPRFLYCGAVNSRMDLKALEALDAAVPQGRILLLGDVEGSELRSALAALKTVTLLSGRDREQVRAANFACDVGIIPHLDNALTRAMSPLKLYEYKAAGLPVVARDLEPIRSAGGALLYSQPAEFVAQCLRAISEPPATETQRLDYIRENSWSRRFDELLAFLAQG